MNKQQRLEEANKLIKSISSYGRKFFSGKSGCASLGYGIKPRVFFTDAKTSALIDTHEHEWIGFSHGGTLRVLIEYLRDYINEDEKVSIECICTLRRDGSDIWGYGKVEAEKLVNEVKGLDMFNAATTQSVRLLKTHLRVTGVDARDSHQTEFEYSHQAKCGYVRDLVSLDIEDVTCKLCIREAAKEGLKAENNYGN